MYVVKNLKGNDLVKAIEKFKSTIINTKIKWWMKEKISIYYDRSVSFHNFS